MVGGLDFQSPQAPVGLQALLEHIPQARPRAHPWVSLTTPLSVGLGQSIALVRAMSGKPGACCAKCHSSRKETWCHDPSQSHGELRVKTPPKLHPFCSCISHYIQPSIHSSIHPSCYRPYPIPATSHNQTSHRKELDLFSSLKGVPGRSRNVCLIQEIEMWNYLESRELQMS